MIRIITAPVGSIVTSATSNSNNGNVLQTTDLIFTVTYPAGFVGNSAIDPKTVAVTAANGVGFSLVNKTLTIASAMASIGTALGGTTFARCVNTNQTFAVPAVIGATNYIWEVANGAVIVKGQGTNAIEVNFSNVLSTVTKTTLKVTAKNICGVYSSTKSINLSSIACTDPNGRQANNGEVVAENIAEVCPNPTSGDFKIKLNVSKAGIFEMIICAIDGVFVTNSKIITLGEGVNVVSDSVYALEKGIYFVRLTNTSTGEIIVKKVIKE